MVDKTTFSVSGARGDVGVSRRFQKKRGMIRIIPRFVA
jgi:hypothetical protein